MSTDVEMDEARSSSGATRPLTSGNSETPLNRMTPVAFWCSLLLIVTLEATGGEASRALPAVAGASTNAVLYPVIIKRALGPPKVATGLTNFHGQPVMVSCSSCHTTTKPNLENRSTADLDQFHQGLKYVHGNLSCLSCHNPKNYDTLHLADGHQVEFTDVITLCSQCHGPQRRDYEQGLHGGMNGYWDRTRGGRTRNTCINCHDPHAPLFPLVMPVLPPRDRISVLPKARKQPPKH